MPATETVANPISPSAPMPKPSVMMSVRSVGRTAKPSAKAKLQCEMQHGLRPE